MQPNPEAQPPELSEPPQGASPAGTPSNQPEAFTPPGFPPSSSYSLPLNVAGHVTPQTPPADAERPATPPRSASSPYSPEGSYEPPPPGYVPPPDYPVGSYPLAGNVSASGIYMPPSLVHTPSSVYATSVIRQERQPRDNTPLIISLVICGLLIVVVGGVAFARNLISSQSANQPNAALVSNGSTTSEAISHHFQTGQQVRIADTWLMTINGAQATTGNQVDQQQLKPGDTYVLVDLTVKNASSSAQDLLGFVSFAMQDASGKTYAQTVFSGQNVPDGSLSAGQQMHGLVAFEVPASLHHLIFTYNDPAFGAPVLWDVSV